MMELFTLSDIIENAARLYPDQVAYKYDANTVTFLEFHEKTDQLAHHLVTSGVKKGDRVGIYLNRCLETAIAIHGVLKSGAAYVPLDFTAPESRTQYLIEHCGIEILLTTSKHKSKVKKLLDYSTSLKQVIGQEVAGFDNSITWESIYNLSLGNYKKVKITEHDLAYIMFTSGSTGVPKGIMHTHGSGLNYARLSAELYGVTPNDIFGNHAPIHFDISTFGYFSAPLAGATTIIVSDAHTKMPVSLIQLMAKEQITIWYSVPLALVQMLLSGVIHKFPMKSLRWVLFGGEVFGLKYLKDLMGIWSNTWFSNVYGPAEVNQCTYYNFDVFPENMSQLPIGKVWRNTEFKILDNQDNEVPKGTKGALVIRSGTMMKGYWKNNELTQKAFYKAHSETDIDYIYYRTGDIVFEDENDDLIFVGRNDRQIKMRGYRIELDEVESVLIRYPAVKEAAVTTTEIDTDKKEVYAAVILFPEQNASMQDLISHCKKHLPVYSVPNQIKIVSEFPRTSSGKINRKSMTN